MITIWRLCITAATFGTLLFRKLLGFLDFPRQVLDILVLVGANACFRRNRLLERFFVEILLFELVAVELLYYVFEFTFFFSCIELRFDLFLVVLFVLRFFVVQLVFFVVL